MSTSLVTGGAGFLGTHVVKELLKQGHNVVILDDLSGGYKENIDKKAVFIEGSINDERLLSRVFKRYNFDYVYHLAAYAAEGLSHFIKRFNYTNNLIGSVNLINESVKHNVKCFVFTSSIAVYGSQKPPMTEAMEPKPEDPYGIAKYAIEMELRITYEMFGLNYIIFRPHNVYGEYQNIGDMYRNVVGIFMNRLMQGEKLSVFGDGNQTRAFSYIDDVAPYIARSAGMKDAYNEVFNIGGEKKYTINELASATMKAMQMKAEIVYLPPRNEVLHAYCSHKKVNKIFNLNRATPLVVGLAKMASWAKKAGIKKSKKFKDIELTVKLPAIWAKN
jgi:UDP-glucose 4-epimerase